LDPKPFSGVGAPSSNPLYLEVGRACGYFENIQDEVIELFQHLTGGTPHDFSPMVKIIGATSSFNVKMDLVEEATRRFVSEERTQRAVLGWLRLCRKAVQVRNQIIHGQVMHVHYVHDSRSVNGFFLLPSLYSTKKLDFPATPPHQAEYCWNSPQLQDYVTMFGLLRAMVMTVREELSGTGDKPCPQVLDPDTMTKKRA
jgi:hypothetical protein